MGCNLANAGRHAIRILALLDEIEDLSLSVSQYFHSRYVAAGGKL
jgi:hypothetical protein